MKSNKLKREPKYIAKFKAFPYQQEAVDAVKDLEYAAIFHEQGLGKTKIAIDMYLFQIVLRELIKSLDQNETFC